MRLALRARLSIVARACGRLDWAGDPTAVDPSLSTIPCALLGRSSDTRVMRLLLPRSQQFFRGEVNIVGDLAQERRRNVTALVDGHGCHTSIGMPELLV